VVQLLGVFASALAPSWRNKDLWEGLCQATGLQGCLFLVPLHFNKIFYFYIVFDGLAMGVWGHENTIKTREIGGVNFHLKEWPRPGTTKLSIALSAEWGHRAACLAQAVERLYLL